jgi:hypothetical protein
MKKIVTLLPAILLVLTAFTQTKPSFVAINIGASFPIGDYAKTAEGNDGFATTGANFAVEGAWFFYEYIGVGGYIGGSAHPINEDELVNYYKKGLNATSVTVETNPYAVANYMLGIYFSYPATEKISINAKVLGGILLGQLPEITVKATAFLQSASVKSEQAMASQFAPLAGVGVRFHLSKRIGLAINGEYTGAKPEFEVKINGVTQKVEQQFSMINASLGLNIMLGKQE